MTVSNLARKNLLLGLAVMLLLLGIWWSSRERETSVTEGPRRPETERSLQGEDPAVERLLDQGAAAANSSPCPEPDPAPRDEESAESPGADGIALETSYVDLLAAELANAPSILGMGEGQRLIHLDGCVRLHESLAGARVKVSLRSDEGGEVSASTTGVNLPTVLWGMEQGTYAMELSAEKDGVLVRAKRSVFVGNGPVDLPVVELVPMAGVRARVVDADGIPVLQARILVVRPEELAVGGRRIEPGPEGWIHYADLEPGVDHRLVVDGVQERMERVVRVPFEPKGTAVEEVRLASRLVPVKLRFATRDDKTIAFKAVEPSISNTGHRWKDCEELPDRLLPGEYEFHTEDLAGRVTIPPDLPFEATILMEPAE